MAEEQQASAKQNDVGNQLSELTDLVKQVQERNRQMMLLIVAIILFALAGLILSYTRLSKVGQQVDLTQQMIQGVSYQLSYDPLLDEFMDPALIIDPEMDGDLTLPEATDLPEDQL